MRLDACANQPKARFTMPPGVRDVTAAALGTLHRRGQPSRADSARAARSLAHAFRRGGGTWDSPQKRIGGLTSADVGRSELRQRSRSKGLGRTTPAVFDPFHPLGQPQPRLCGQQPHLARVLAPGPLCLAHGGTPTVPILLLR